MQTKRRLKLRLAILVVSATAGGNMTAAASADLLQTRGSEVLFSGFAQTESAVYAVSPETREERQVTLAGQDADEPTWSPDHSSLAFVEYSVRRDYPGETRSAIVMSDSSGLIQQQLTDGSAWDAGPTWSPDGFKIAFVRYEATGWSHIGVVDVTSGEVEFATPEAMVGDIEPTWFPSGDRIAFTRFENGKSSVYSVNADGSGLQRLVSSRNADLSDPDISPDGKRMAYMKQPFGDDSDICVHKMSAESSRCYAVSRHLESQPTWAADSTRLAFVRTPGDADGDLWTVSLRTGTERRLTRGPARDFEPAWSASGRKIAFIRFVGDSNSEVHLTRANGKAQSRLTANDLDEFSLDW